MLTSPIVTVGSGSELSGGAGPNFVLTTPQGPRDEYISVIGFYAVFGELKGYLYWTSDFGSGVVTSNSIMGGITLNFLGRPEYEYKL